MNNLYIVLYYIKMAYRKFYRRRPRKYLRKRKSVKKPSKFLKTTIQKIISKNVEDKSAFHDTGDSLVYCNSGINSSGDMMRILPNIYKGTNEQERVGAQIRAKSLVIKGYLQLEKDQVFGDVSNKRIAVRLMVVSMKKYKTLTDVQNYAGAGLIEKGGTASNFSGYISHLWAPINPEEYIKHYDKVFYLAQDYVAQQVGSSTPTTVWSQDISKGIRFFTIRIPLRGKKLIYSQDTGSDIQPVNFAPVLCMGYAHLDGSSPDTVSTKVGICYDVTFNYEDA